MVTQYLNHDYLVIFVTGTSRLGSNWSEFSENLRRSLLRLFEVAYQGKTLARHRPGHQRRTIIYHSWLEFGRSHIDTYTIGTLTALRSFRSTTLSLAGPSTLKRQSSPATNSVKTDSKHLCREHHAHTSRRLSLGCCCGLCKGHNTLPWIHRKKREENGFNAHRRLDVGRERM